MNLVRSKLLTLLAVTLLAACGGSPTGNDGTVNGNEDTRTIKTSPLLDEDIQEIFRMGCNSENCHGSTMQGGLGLASANESFMDLVNVPSEGDPRVDRVEPGDAVNSYLWLRVSGSTAGARMPVGGPNLDDIDLANIMNWINSGARLN